MMADQKTAEVHVRSLSSFRTRVRKQNENGLVDPKEYARQYDDHMSQLEEERRKRLQVTKDCWKEALAKLPRRKPGVQRALIPENDQWESAERNLAVTQSSSTRELDQIAERPAEPEVSPSDQETREKILNSHRELWDGRFASYRRARELEHQVQHEGDLPSPQR